MRATTVTLMVGENEFTTDLGRKIVLVKYREKNSDRKSGKKRSH